MSVINKAKLAIISIVNTPNRIESNGSWCDEETLVNNKRTKVYNPKSIDLRFKGHLSTSDLSSTKLFTQGFLLGSEIRAINDSIAKGKENYDSSRLQLVEDAEYHILPKATKGSTRKSKFRTATFKDSNELVTFVSLSVPFEREPSVSVEVAI